jgi:hypothetical protein
VNVIFDEAPKGRSESFPIHRHPAYDKRTGDIFRHHGNADVPKLNRPKPRSEVEIAQAVNRGDIPVEKVLRTHPHLAGQALVQQHEREKAAGIKTAYAKRGMRP